VADALRVTIAAVLLLTAIGIISQVGNFLALILKFPQLAKWTNVLTVVLSALVISWWVLEVG